MQDGLHVVVEYANRGSVGCYAALEVETLFAGVATEFKVHVGLVLHTLLTHDDDNPVALAVTFKYMVGEALEGRVGLGVGIGRVEGASFHAVVMLHGVELVGHIVEAAELCEMPVEVAQTVVTHSDGVDNGDAGAALHVAAVFFVDAVLVHHHEVGLGPFRHGCRKVLDA